MTQCTNPPLTPDQLTAAENFDDGYHAGWADALRTLAERDERIARRITALLIQHDYNGRLVEWVTQLKPYQERGIPRVSA